MEGGGETASLGAGPGKLSVMKGRTKEDQPASLRGEQTLFPLPKKRSKDEEGMTRGKKQLKKQV